MYRRAKKAVDTVRIFLSKHMKSKDVKLGQKLNLLLWERGIRHPPGKVKVVVTKDDKGLVKAELFGHTYVDKKKVEKVEKSKLEQLKEKLGGKTAAEEHNKEAIEHIHDHAHPHDHTPADNTKALMNTKEKEMKVTTGTIQGGHRDKK